MELIRSNFPNVLYVRILMILGSGCFIEKYMKCLNKLQWYIVNVAIELSMTCAHREVLQG